MFHTASGMRDRRRGWRVDCNDHPEGRESVTRRSTARSVCASLGWLPATDTSWRYKESVPGVYLFQEDRNGTICGTPRRIINSTCAVRLIEPKWGGCGVASRSSKAYLYATTHPDCSNNMGP